METIQWKPIKHKFLVIDYITLKNCICDTKEEAEEIAKTCKKPSIVNLDDEMALMEWKYEKK